MGVERITAHGRKLSGVEHIKQESQLLRGSIAAELASDSTHFAEADTQLLKVHGTYQQYDRDDATAHPRRGSELDLQSFDLEVLSDDGKGVQLTWRAMWHLYGAGIRSKASLAKTYGGNHNLPDVPPAWINSEQVQKAYQLLGPINFIDTDYRQNMRLLAGAFWIARQNGDFPRAFGVSQEDAAALGAPLRDIVTNKGRGPNPNLIADLRKFVMDQVGATA